MRRILTMLATALLASTLLASAAEARGGGGGLRGGGHVGSFGGVMQMAGGFGGSMGHFGRGHAMPAFGPRYDYGYAPSCYYPDEAPKAPPWPPYCG